MLFFKRHYNPQEEEQLDFLDNVNLFNALTKEEKSCFLPYLHIRNYNENEVVFFRGDASQALYLVIDGKVEINVDIRQTQTFEHIIQLNKYNSFGDNALLNNQTRIFNAIAQQKNTKLYVIPQVNIQEIFAKKPSIKAKVLENLAELQDAYFRNICDTYREGNGFFELRELFLKMNLGF